MKMNHKGMRLVLDLRLSNLGLTSDEKHSGNC